MPNTSQMLAEYPDILLQVLAELRGAFLDAAENRREAVELLSAQLTDPTSVLMAYQEVIDFHPHAQAALEALLAAGGALREAQFSREFGSIRQMGTAKLEREQPWHAPESVAELLYYYGLIGRGFKGAGQNAHTIVYIPTDVTPWLPKPASDQAEGGLPVSPAPPPPASRMLLSEDAFLEDAGALLGFLHTRGLRLLPGGAPDPEDIELLSARLQTAHGFVSPFTPPDPTAQLEDTRLALLLHLANRLGWLRRAEDDLVRLTGNRVYAFLEQTRPEQRFALWEAWRTSPDWNDLRRIPGLDCSGGDWRNDALQTRQAVIQLLTRLQPGAWYSQADFIAAVKEHAPDFQRPTGDYDSWYIRDITTQEFLRGFAHWEQVEGVLLRFILNGPLYWLSAVDVAEPSAGDDLLFSLSGWGARWLGQDSVLPDEPPRRPLTVEEDFTVRLPLGTALMDRFRVERFADWQQSHPQFVYQINRRSLQRAAAEGVSTDRILAFLKSKTRRLPERVESGLLRFGQSASPTPV